MRRRTAPPAADARAGSMGGFPPAKMFCPPAPGPFPQIPGAFPRIPEVFPWFPATFPQIPDLSSEILRRSPDSRRVPPESQTIPPNSHSVPLTCCGAANDSQAALRHIFVLFQAILNLLWLKSDIPGFKSGGWPPQSKTQSVCRRRANGVNRRGMLQSSGALRWGEAADEPILNCGDISPLFSSDFTRSCHRVWQRRRSVSNLSYPAPPVPARSNPRRG